MAFKIVFLAAVTFAVGCAGIRVSVARDAGAVDAVLVAPLEFGFLASPSTEYEKAAEVIETLRARGALVIDASESDGAAASRARAELAARLGRAPRVAVLRTWIERHDLDWKIPSAPAAGGLAPQPSLQYRVIAYRVRLTLEDGAGRPIARAAFDPDESDLGPGRAGVLDPEPVLTAGLRGATAELARALALRPRESVPGLAYVDTHRRMWRSGAADAGARDYFFSMLPIDWRRVLDDVDGGVLVTAVPPSWGDRVRRGDVLLAVDGRHLDSAAACDRLLDGGEHRVRVARPGLRTDYVLGGAPRAGVRVAGAAR
ncbi:MAG TPA: hypothetical protein VFF06_26610 [Polyangia bacterium]|nr:hypothetical protein [Polyangia bacterium]